MNVAWTFDAEQDRGAIWEVLHQRDPAAAARIDGLFAAAAMRLAEFPYLGHPGDVPGTREMTPHRRYRLIYEVS